MTRLFKPFGAFIILSALGMSGPHAADDESMYETCKEAAEAVGLTEPDEVNMYVEQCIVDMRREGDYSPQEQEMDEPADTEPSSPGTAD